MMIRRSSSASLPFDGQLSLLFVDGQIPPALAEPQLAPLERVPERVAAAVGAAPAHSREAGLAPDEGRGCETGSRSASLASGQAVLMSPAPALVRAEPRVSRGSKPCRQAEVFKNYGQVRQVERHIDENCADPESCMGSFHASVYAGLRPCEIAGLLVRTLLTGSGALGDHLEVLPGTSKRGKGRTLTLHPVLRATFERLRAAHPRAERIAFSCRPDGSYRYWDAKEVTRWFSHMYRAAGLPPGFTGMSGRRTLGTRMADASMLEGRSIFEVQRALGHANLATTQLYIRMRDPSDAAVEDAVRRLGAREPCAPPRVDQQGGFNG